MNIEELKAEVQAISAAVTKLRHSGISDRALLILIQESTGNAHRTRNGWTVVPKKTIAAVMDGMQNLEDFLTEEE